MQAVTPTSVQAEKLEWFSYAVKASLIWAALVKSGVVIEINKVSETTYNVSFQTPTATLHVGRRRSLEGAKAHAQYAVDVLRLMPPNN